MSPLETLAHQQFPDLSPAEITLLSKASIGELAVCGPSDNLNNPMNDPQTAKAWGKDRHIRGELIAWLCADRQAKLLVDPGGIQVIGARIMTGVKLLSVTIEFPLAFACCEFRDEINLQSASTRVLSFVQTHLQSIFADGAVIAGGFLLRESRATQLQFPGARIEGQFDCDGSAFNKLILDGAVINVGVLMRRVEGQVKMSRAQIAMDLDCGGASFIASQGSPDPAFEASGVNVEGSVFLRAGFRAVGSVRLLGAHIGSNLECTDAEFTSAGSHTADGGSDALRADSVVVQGAVFLAKGFRARGEVSFISCQIGGDFNCAHSEFETGLIVERANIKGTFFWRAVTLSKTARLDLLNTSVGSLGDDSQSWPSRGHLQIHGFVYKQISLASPKNAKARLDWLDRQNSYSRQPYRQLASLMRDEGNEKDARRVLYNMKCLAEPQENRSTVDRLWRSTLKCVVGYGYYPFRALRWFSAIVLLGFLFFDCGFYAGSMVPTDKEAYASFTRQHLLPGHYARFHAFIYSVENSFPLVKLGQADLWQPDPASQGVENPCKSPSADIFHWFFAPNVLLWFRWGQIVAGWILATIWIGGLTGLVRKD